MLSQSQQSYQYDSCCCQTYKGEGHSTGHSTEAIGDAADGVARLYSMSICVEVYKCWTDPGSLDGFLIKSFYARGTSAPRGVCSARSWSSATVPAQYRPLAPGATFLLTARHAALTALTAGAATALRSSMSIGPECRHVVTILSMLRSGSYDVFCFWFSFHHAVTARKAPHLNLVKISFRKL